MKLYQIKDWDAHFENSKSREREKCSFCCLPNKQDGLGYGLLLRHERGEALYGAFVAVVLVASKQKRRNGWLTDTGMPAGCPLTARQLSIKTNFAEKTIEEMLEVVSSNEIGWIVISEAPSKTVPAECPPSALERREEKERNEEKEAVVFLIYDAYPLKVAKPKALEAIRKALKKETPARLIERTRAYAAVRGDDLSYVPNPATWFNAERYNDDPSTWVRAQKPRGGNDNQLGETF
jgi:hypothetical protein